MSDLDLVFDTTPIENAETIDDLKTVYVEKQEEISSTFDWVVNEREQLTERRDELMESTSGVGRFFGGITGDDKVKELNNVKADLEEFDSIEVRLNEFSDELGGFIGRQGQQILARNDEEVARLCDYRDLLDEACLRTEEVLTEIDEALAALEEAEDAEEWDQMTDSAWLDMESDDANRQASYEVDDVNRILVSYRDFLNSIGESAHGLMGSDFQFDWYDAMMEDSWSSFWGSEDQLNQLARAQNQMFDLRNRVAGLFETFAADFDNVENQLQVHLDEAWGDEE